MPWCRNILTLAHAGILHSSMPEDISGMGEGQNLPEPTGAFSFPELLFSRGKLHFV
jgi:hypothetical protein